MNITLTIEAPELVGAIENLAAALGSTNPLAGVSAETKSEIVKPLETQTPKEEPKPEPKPEKEAPPVEEKQPEAEPPKEEQESTVSLDVLTTKTREYIQADPGNKNNLKFFLNQKGVKKVSDLPASERESAIAFMEGAE